MNLMCLELLLRVRRSRHHSSPKATLALILASGAVFLFNRIVKKYAPDMNEKLKSVISVVIALAVIVLFALITR